MPDTQTFFAKLTNINFTVKNLYRGKRLTIFNFPIEPGQTRDLLAIPEISEADIRHSLIKGQLANLIRMRAIYVVSSSIDLLQFDSSQAAFLAAAGVPPSTLSASSSPSSPSSPSGTAGGDLTGTYPNPTLISIGTAGTYGDPSHYPVITIDGKGRITSVYAQTVPLTSPLSFTAGGDLTGTTTSQQVAKITAATGNFDWAATTINPSIIHLPKTTDVSPTNILINAQNAWTSAVTNIYGGSLTVSAGAASDGAHGASITLDGASPRSVANASDIAMSADQVVFSAATTASANTLILDPINAAIYFNSASPTPSIGTTSRYFSNVYTNNIYVNQITNGTAPTANQTLVQNAAANGFEWSGPVLGELICTSGPSGGTILPVYENQWSQINLWSSNVSNGITANSSDGYMTVLQSGWYQYTIDVSFIAPATSILQLAMISNGSIVDVSSSISNASEQVYIAHMSQQNVGDVVGISVQLLNNPLSSGSIPFQLTYGRFGAHLIR